MDVQFSGAIDFSPLFNNTTNPYIGKTPFGVGKRQSDDFYQQQNALLEPLNWQNQLFMATEEVGSSVDIQA